MGLDNGVIGPGEEIPPGTVIAGFEHLTPHNDGTCEKHIARTIASGLPDVISRQKLTIIASGPSAGTVNLRAIQGPTLAVNGALKLFTAQERQPTYWAACDPQEIVADFIPDNPPESTIYLVASKCHPKVFEKLKNRTVWLWHLKDYPAQGRFRTALCTSVTLSATWLMSRIGFTDFEYWGWDGCFMDGRHHANNNDDWSKADRLQLNYGGTMMGTEIIGGRIFETTRTWAAEAQCAEQFFQLAEYFDMNITIRGDGMFACAQKFIMGNK